MESYRLLEEVGASFLHIFPFSERPGTPAVDMPNKVQPSISTERVARLEELSTRLHRSFAERYLNTERDVLFESTEHDGRMYGYTDNYLRVHAAYNERYINTICRVALKEIDADGNISCEIVG
jgi:threonylcarbamoyladenosine tRNA methylthiotransferase MtaB